VPVEDRPQNENIPAGLLVFGLLLLLWYLRPRLAAAIPEVEMPGKTPQYETWST